MADRIEFREVTRAGTPGDLVAAAELATDGVTVTYTGAVAQDTLASLARHARRSETAMFALVREHGWSNGWLMAVNA